MSAAAKFGMRLQASAFMAGYTVAVRNERMIQAHELKRAGASPERIRFMVADARRVNHELVRHLRDARQKPFADHDRERRISATGAFGRVPYNPPAGSLE